MINCIKCGIETDITIDELCFNCAKNKAMADNSIDKWIVFWKDNCRIGSIELNESNWKQIKEQLIYNVIQTDVTGTIHLEITGLIDKPNKANHGK